MIGTKQPRTVVLSSGVGRRWPKRNRRRLRFVVHEPGTATTLPAGSLYVGTLDELDEGAGRDLRAKRPAGVILLDQGTRSEAILARLRLLGPRLIPRLHLRTVDQRGLKDFLLRLSSILGSRRSGDAILDAWWDSDTFVVLSSDLRALRVPFQELKQLYAFRDAARPALEAFEMDADGVYVYWPAIDVHMTWEAFEEVVDPKARLAAQHRGAAFDRRYGRAIRCFRQEKRLRQQDISGIDPRHVRRIEHGQQRATLGALRKLAYAHGLSLRDYLDALAERM